MSKSDIVNEIHKPARKNYKRRRVVVKGLNDLWQADLVEMIPHAKQNKNFRYVLVVINVFSKYAWAEPIKNKTCKNVAAAFKKILDASTVPKLLQTDKGLEFYGKEFQTLVKKYGIRHYSTFSNLKASVAERVIRTLKGSMYKRFSLNGNYRWLKELPDVMTQYNDSFHRTIKMKFKDVTLADEIRLLQTVNAPPKLLRTKKKSTLKVGDLVRVSKYKHIVDKGYNPNWSTEIFNIARVRDKFEPVTFNLSDSENRPISGTFYQEELQKTHHPDIYLVEKVLKRKDGQVYVKWLGFKEKTWINENDLL